MVEINNQRKAFLDMLVVGGTDNGRQKTRNHKVTSLQGVESYLLINSINSSQTPR